MSETKKNTESQREIEIKVKWLQNAYNLCVHMMNTEPSSKDYWRGKSDGYESVAFNIFGAVLQRQEEA